MNKIGKKTRWKEKTDRKQDLKLNVKTRKENSWNPPVLLALLGRPMLGRPVHGAAAMICNKREIGFAGFAISELDDSGWWAYVPGLEE